MKSVVVLLFSINTVLAMTGSLEVNVMETKKAQFWSFFNNRIDETVGSSDSPEITREDVIRAIKEEFKDSRAAFKQLESLKGKGGKTIFEFGYLGSDDNKSNVEGDLISRCGVVSANADYKPDGYTMHMESGSSSTYSPEGGDHFPHLGGTGKFFQLKWASKAQIQRYIAKCFANLPGMPELKQKDPKDKTMLYVGDEMYEEFYNWFSSIKGVGSFHSEHKRFRAAVKCLLKNAIERMPDRTGNRLVLQLISEKRRVVVHNDEKGLINEFEYLGSSLGISKKMHYNYREYSLAAMDAHSFEKIKDNWEDDTIQTEGIWPNVRANSLESLLGQIYGDQLYVNMKACMLSAGLAIPNPNYTFETIYDVRKCREVDTESLSTFDKLEVYCEMGRGDSCMLLGQSYLQGKELHCPKDIPGAQGCHLINGKVDKEKGLKYLMKGCNDGSAASCWLVAKKKEGFRDPRFPNLLNQEYKDYYVKACKLRPDIEECKFHLRGVIPINDTTVVSYERACEIGMNRRKNCYSLALYYANKGNSAKEKEFVIKACRAMGLDRDPSACIRAQEILVKEKKPEEAIKLLQHSCNFVDKIGCSELYELYEQQGDKVKAAELIKRICWDKDIPSKKCF